MMKDSTNNRPPAVQQARELLRRKGWRQAEVARELGVTPVHLSYVLNGRRESKRILAAIADLPSNPQPA